MVPKFYSSLCEWIFKNPVEATDYETMFKWGSLLLAGRTQSPVIPEFVNALSNLMTLHNDIIILKKCQLFDNDIIKTYLSVLEHSEIFLELFTERFFKSKVGYMIFIIQAIKLYARLHLVHKKKTLLANPPISSLDRFSLKEKLLHRASQEPGALSSDSMLGLLTEIQRRVNESRSEIIAMPRKKYFAELLYLLKPMSHLLMTFWFGKSSWRPYQLSLAMDVISLYLLTRERRKHEFTFEETYNVIPQRYSRMLLYLWRSPFYDQYFKNFIVRLLNPVFKNVALIKFIFEPLLKYFMSIQHIYFYMWSS